MSDLIQKYWANITITVCSLHIFIILLQIQFQAFTVGEDIFQVFYVNRPIYRQYLPFHQICLGNFILNPIFKVQCYRTKSRLSILIVEMSVPILFISV